MTQKDDATFPTGQELYDLLMATIDPDLVSSQIQNLAKKYASESPEEEKARFERYEKAYTEYDRRFKEFLVDMDVKVREYKRGALKSAEKQSREEEQRDIDALEAAMNTHK